MLSKVRTQVLMWIGRSWPLRIWARRRCRAAGIEVHRPNGAIELRKGDRAIRLAFKHIFFAPEVCQSFDAFAQGLPVTAVEGLRITDFASSPDAFNHSRSCLAEGVVLDVRETGVWLHKGQRAMILSLRHLVYAVDLAKSFEIYFAPLVPERRNGLEVLDFSRPGILQTYASSGLQFEMASFPEEEDAIEEYFRWYRPRPGDLVFDMGAHCGVSSYHFSKLVGDAGKVISFEPDPLNYSILLRNIERHNLRNVMAVNAAIADRSGQMMFNAEGTIGSGLVSVLRRESVGRTVAVEAMTLCDTFARWGKPAFCKIDIEGAEISVLASARKVLTEQPTHLALDTNHPQGNGEMTGREVEAILQDYGYETLSEARPLLTTWARPKT